MTSEYIASWHGYHCAVRIELVARKRKWSLYVVKLHEEARERVLARMQPLARFRINRRLPCVYVGVTALTPEERYARHREVVSPLRLSCVTTASDCSRACTETATP